jgi:hypothetical protein
MIFSENRYPLFRIMLWKSTQQDIQRRKPMREVDRRSKYDRRVFLKGAATTVPAVAVATSTGLGLADAWADDATALSPATLKTLVKAARDIYPHDFLADSYYITAVKPWDGKAAKDPAVKAMITDGVARLDQNAQDRHKVPYAQVAWETDRVALLQAIEQSEFFQKVRGDLIVSLYNQKEVWPKFGYEGSSAEHGGYINRGFADIDWLPKA